MEGSREQVSTNAFNDIISAQVVIYGTSLGPGAISRGTEKATTHVTLIYQLEWAKIANGPANLGAREWLHIAVPKSTGLSQTQTTSNHMTMAWNKQSGTIYKMTVLEHGQPPPGLPPPGDQDVTSPHLVNATSSGESFLPNSHYDVYLFALNGGNENDYVTIPYVDAKTAFSEPTNVTVVKTSSTTINLSWLPPTEDGRAASVDGYRVTWSPPSLDGRSSVDVLLDTAIEVTGLSPNTDYDVTVTTFSSAGEGKESGTITGTTTYSKPINVAVEDTTSSSIDITWAAPDDGGDATPIIGYIVSWLPADNTGLMAVDGADTLQATIPGLTSNTEYSVSVAARSSPGVGEDSDPESGTTTFSKPTGITISSSTFSSIALTWTAPEDGGGANEITGYKVSWSPAEDAGFDLTGKAETTTITGLHSNTEYSIQVAAQSSSGVDGEISDAEAGTTTFSKPTGITFAGSKSSSIDLAWTEPGAGGGAKPIDNYIVSWSTTDSSDSMLFPGNAPVASIPELTSNTNYELKVAAQSLFGDGEFSTAMDAATAPAPPTAVLVSYTLSTQFQVTWDHSTDDEVHATTKYRLLCTPTDGGLTVEKVTTNMDKFFTIDSLVSNTEYSVTVTALTDDVNIFSDASEEALHTTGAYIF
ncbi:fibronectin-like [Clavelina lepadiformis]|uniref:fibronectin-like n=1 Tax=Clavelina lepadiformis TaxID=159417 RepID=UPI004041C254